MEWLNLHTSILDSEEFIGSAPTDRATWLCLLRFCAGQENGGTIRECAAWTDRKWQQLARITKREIDAVCELWCWDGNNLVVRFYPITRENQIRNNRLIARDGAKARWKDHKPAAIASANGMPSPMPHGMPHGIPDGNAIDSKTGNAEGEGEGEEEGEEERNINRKGTRARDQPVNNSARITISDYPDIFRSESDPIDLAINLTGDQQPQSIGGWRKQLRRIGEPAFRRVLAEFWGESKQTEFRNPGAVLSAKLKEAKS